MKTLPITGSVYSMANLSWHNAKHNRAERSEGPYLCLCYASFLYFAETDFVFNLTRGSSLPIIGIQTHKRRKENALAHKS